MFTKEDVLKLFDLLERLHPNKKQQRDKVNVAIWTEVLKPWKYEQARDAAIRRSRVNRYAPDPAELAEYLPRIPEQADEQLEELRTQWMVLKIQRQAAGLPGSICEARTAGWHSAQWEQAVDAAGLSLYQERSHG